MKNHSVFVDFSYLGPSVSDLIFPGGAFDPLWAPLGSLGSPCDHFGIPLGPCWGSLDLKWRLWGHFGPSCASFLHPFDSLWAPFKHLGTCLLYTSDAADEL